MPRPKAVAALYVERDGIYYGLPGVDPWDAERDARLYEGPHPVVAHPPCNKWSPLTYINRRRIPGYEIGDDGGCFEAALNAVRTYGGVLEHPAGSLAWKHFGLTRPRRGMWLNYEHGWVTEVDQGRYGHRARKRTWLMVCGPEPPALDWTPADSGVVVSGFTHQPKGEHVACEHRRVRPKEASRTPAAFRDVAPRYGAERRKGGRMSKSAAQPHGEPPESVYGLVDWMREQDVKVGRMRLVHSDGESITLLIGRANRADDLDALYETLDTEPVINVTFDPPVKLPKEAS